MLTTTPSPRGTLTAATPPWPPCSLESSSSSWSATQSRSPLMCMRLTRYLVNNFSYTNVRQTGYPFPFSHPSNKMREEREEK